MKASKPVAAKEQSQSKSKEIAVPISTGDSLAGLAAEVRESVGRRAYGFFEARGRDHGQDLADWFRAEGELTPLEERVSESSNQVRIQASLDGLSDSDLRVGVDRGHVIVTASRRPADGHAEREIATAKVISLPAEVDPAGSTATSDGRTLTIVLPKADARRAQAS